MTGGSLSKPGRAESLGLQTRPFGQQLRETILNGHFAVQGAWAPKPMGYGLNITLWPAAGGGIDAHW